MKAQSSSLRNRVLNITKNSPRVAILMSGGGNNASNILSKTHMYPTLSFIAVATDNPLSNAEKVAKKNGLLYIEIDWKKKRSRNEFFRRLLKKLRNAKIDLLLYCGFMKIVPKFFPSFFKSSKDYGFKYPEHFNGIL